MYMKELLSLIFSRFLVFIKSFVSSRSLIFSRLNEFLGLFIYFFRIKYKLNKELEDRINILMINRQSFKNLKVVYKDIKDLDYSNVEQFLI